MKRYELKLTVVAESEHLLETIKTILTHRVKVQGHPLVSVTHARVDDAVELCEMAVTVSPAKRLTRKDCARLLRYAQGYLRGFDLACDLEMLGTLASVLAVVSEEVTVVGWMCEHIRLCAEAAALRAPDIAAQLNAVADALQELPATV